MLLGLMAGVSQVHARTLSGTLLLSEGMNIVLEMNEGTLSEVCRFVHLTNAPRERVDLTRLSSSGDRIFIGTDYCLYCERRVENEYPKTEAYKIGEAHKLWDIRLLDGVQLVEVCGGALGSFTGEKPSKVLRVEGTKMRKGSDVERAGLKFWLDEVVYQYDSPGSRKDHHDNFRIITEGLLGALPSRSDEPTDRIHNLKIFRAFIKESRDSDLVSLRDLLTRKLTAIQNERKKAGAEKDKYETLTKEYESLKTEIVKRTEGN